ncbi:MAG: LVIVD repeat-containing protein, partial [Candidatus Hodarchaeales archaeon]
MIRSRKLIVFISGFFFLILFVVGLFAFNVINLNQNKGTFTELGQIETNGECMKVEVHDNVAFIVDTTDDNPGGLMLIDVSDPTTPTLLGSYYDLGMIIDFTIKGDIAYCANIFNGLEILNISDYENVHRIGHYGGTIYDVMVEGDLAYIGAWSHGFKILNISDPTAPFRVSSTNLDGASVHVSIDENICYITDHLTDYTNIESYNVSNPESPVKLAEIQLNNVDFFELHVSGDYLYAADHGSSGDLFILDISDPTAITEIGRFNSGGTTYGWCVEGTIVYVADYDKGLLV